MAQSRKDKSRKQNVQNYKQKSKKKTMSETPEMKPFHQVPTWSSTETFEIQGIELEALYNFFNIFAPAFTSIQQVFARGIQSGKIKVGYEYQDGTPVGDDEIKAYTEKLNEYFKNRKASDEQVSSEESMVNEAYASTKEEAQPTAKILNLHGAPINND
jgi:hypothetical protein